MASLEEQIQNMDLEVLKTWLRAVSRFHNYSLNNRLLAWIQLMDRDGRQTTRLASYSAWQKLGRQVQKGERKLEILRPIIIRDDDGSETCVGFTGAGVFDISQTAAVTPEGEVLDTDPLAGLQQRLNAEAPEAILDSLQLAIMADGWRSVICPRSLITRGADGSTNWATKTISVADDLSPADQVATFAHEMAHMRMHGPDAKVKTTEQEREVEAEAVAFVVCDFLGIDSREASLGYIISWARAEPAAVRRSLQRILDAAESIRATLLPSDMDAELEEILEQG
jgi:hypothetical protein